MSVKSLNGLGSLAMETYLCMLLMAHALCSSPKCCQKEYSCSFAGDAQALSTLLSSPVTWESMASASQSCDETVCGNFAGTEYVRISEAIRHFKPCSETVSQLRVQIPYTTLRAEVSELVPAVSGEMLLVVAGRLASSYCAKGQTASFVTLCPPSDLSSGAIPCSSASSWSCTACDE